MLRGPTSGLLDIPVHPVRCDHLDGLIRADSSFAIVAFPEPAGEDLRFNERFRRFAEGAGIMYRRATCAGRGSAWPKPGPQCHRSPRLRSIDRGDAAHPQDLLAAQP
jgi:hypothetical protein